MKILKHGDRLYGFHCQTCECYWRAGESETINGVMACPECDNTVRGNTLFPPKQEISIKDDQEMKQIQHNENRFSRQYVHSHIEEVLNKAYLNANDEEVQKTIRSIREELISSLFK